ncbi:MAG: hypothetical protein RLY67_1081, partial [Pseudomonadota bacterium]
PFSVLASAVLFTASAQAAGLNASEQSAIDQANSSIQALEVDRLALQRKAHLTEKDCFKRFVSAACLEEVRQSYFTEEREIDLRIEEQRLVIRRTEAQARRRDREQRAAELKAGRS